MIPLAPLYSIKDVAAFFTQGCLSFIPAGIAMPNSKKVKKYNIGQYAGRKWPKQKNFTKQTKYSIYITYMAKPCNTQQAAKAAGIAVMTLHRWVVAKKLKAPKLRIRNGRAVRLWSTADLKGLRALKQEIYCMGRGRKKGYKRK
jgi:hypothetical protein